MRKFVMFTILNMGKISDQTCGNENKDEAEGG